MSLRSKKKSATDKIVELAPRPFYRIISCRHYEQALQSVQYVLVHGQLQEVIEKDLLFVKSKGIGLFYFSKNHFDFSLKKYIFMGIF